MKGSNKLTFIVENFSMTGKTLKELSENGITMLTMIFNATLKIGYCPKVWKTAKIILKNLEAKKNVTGLQTGFLYHKL